MSTPTNPTIDDWLRHREVTNFDTFAIVNIPGFPSGQQDELLKRLRDDPSLTSGQVDPSALYDRIRDITPPIDEEEDLKESRAMESNARIELERDGCPPCYPAHLNIPLQDVPLECKAITSYWEADAKPSNVVLCAQLNDWKDFRLNQTKWRQSSRFAGFMDSIRVRDVDVNWTHVDPTLKSQLENWEEFEYFHNLRHKRLEEERNYWEKERDAAEKDPDLTYVAEMGFTHVQVCKKRRQFAMDKVRAHEILLRWIKEKKVEMMSRIADAQRSDRPEDINPSMPQPRRSHRRLAKAQEQYIRKKEQDTRKKVTRRAEQLCAKQTRQGRASSRSSLEDRRVLNTKVQGRRALAGTETRTRSGRISKPPVRWVPS